MPRWVDQGAEINFIPPFCLRPSALARYAKMAFASPIARPCQKCFPISRVNMANDLFNMNVISPLGRNKAEWDFWTLHIGAENLPKKIPVLFLRRASVRGSKGRFYSKL